MKEFNVEIMSRKDAITYSYEQHDTKVAMLSICNMYEENTLPNIDNNPENGIMYHRAICFNDVEAGMQNCITESDANKIADFVNTNQNNVDKFIIHCEYGVSRSAGVAAAIMMRLIGDDWSVFNNIKYYPNMTCYRMVLKAFGVNIDEQEILKKKETSRNLANNDEIILIEGS